MPDNDYKAIQLQERDKVQLTALSKLNPHLDNPSPVTDLFFHLLAEKVRATFRTTPDATITLDKAINEILEPWTQQCIKYNLDKEEATRIMEEEIFPTLNKFVKPRKMWAEGERKLAMLSQQAEDLTKGMRSNDLLDGITIPAPHGNAQEVNDEVKGMLYKRYRELEKKNFADPRVDCMKGLYNEFMRTQLLIPKDAQGHDKGFINLHVIEQQLRDEIQRLSGLSHTDMSLNAQFQNMETSRIDASVFDDLVAGKSTGRSKQNKYADLRKDVDKMISKAQTAPFKKKKPR